MTNIKTWNSLQISFFKISRLFSAFVGLALITALTTAANAAPKYSGIVLDAKTGRTLYAHQADSTRYPASLTKMMTLYLTFEALERGKIKKSTRIPVSKKAAAEQPSKLGLRPGSTITVEQAIYALVTKSANDVATAVGEFLGGSEAKFARLMTTKAKSLRMSKTRFRNAHGLPNKSQVTTARDMARLGLALREHFPQYYSYFKTRSFKFGKTNYGNHNKLLGNVRGVDGIKTGYTRASGFNLVSSVRADNRSIVAVVIGGKTGKSRDAQMRKLISQYLKKASRRGKGNFMVKSHIKGLVPTSAAIQTATSIPIPVINRADDQIVPSPQIASAAAIPSPLVPKTPKSGTTKSPVPTLDPIKTASTRKPTGWIIQVGASQSLKEAQGIIKDVQKTGGASLAGIKPFTTEFEKDNSIYYRARFAGFSNQDHAVKTCRSLKKKGVGCWAAQQ